MFNRDFRICPIIALSWGLSCAVLVAGEIEKAKIIELNQSIQTAPEDATLYLERGELYRLDSEYRLALKDFVTAQKLDPDLPAVELARARVYKDINRAEATEAHLLRFLERVPADLTGLRLLASLYAAQERYLEADAVYGQIIDTFESPPVSFYLIRARNRESYDDLEGSLQIIKEAIRQVEWNPMLENRALEYEIKLKRYPDALERTDRLIRNEERQAFRHHKAKGDIYLLAENPTAAEESYRQALTSLESLYPSLTNLPGLRALRDDLIKSIESLD